MKSYYDRLNEFFRANEAKPLSSAAQLVMMHLLHINNRHGNAGSFYCADGRLVEATRLSKGAITESKRILKNRGFIDFKTNKKNPASGTLYRFPDTANPDSNVPLSTNSAAVRDAWIKCAGANLTGGAAMGLIELENRLGTELVVAAIYEADKANTAPRLSFNFVKAVAERMAGERCGVDSGNGVVGDIEGYNGFVERDLPDEYQSLRDAD